MNKNQLEKKFSNIKCVGIIINVLSIMLINMVVIMTYNKQTINITVNSSEVLV